MRKDVEESYTKYLGHLNINVTHDKADRVTPADLSVDKRMDKLLLFIALSGLQVDDSLRCSLLIHRKTIFRLYSFEPIKTPRSPQTSM